MSETKQLHTCEHEGCTNNGHPCYLELGEKPDYYYCAGHMAEEGFCIGCGNFYAGTNEFDFIHPGWCSNCYSEVEQDNDDIDEDDFNFFPHPDFTEYPFNVTPLNKQEDLTDDLPF